MEITLSKLLEGKPTIIKGKEYLATKEYVQAFVDTMSKFTDKFIVNVQEPSQVILTDDSRDTTYNRVWIQAVMPKSEEGLNEIYHFVYGLDMRTPVYKYFRTYGQCAFNTEWLTINKIEGETAPKYSLDNLMKYTNDVIPIVKEMKSTFLDSDKRHSFLGDMIEKAMLYEYNTDAGKTKISPTSVIKAYESVYMDSSSNFYVGDTEETSVWNYFSAFTDILKDDKKDTNHFEKNHLVYLLFKNVIENASN